METMNDYQISTYHGVAAYPGLRLLAILLLGWMVATPVQAYQVQVGATPVAADSATDTAQASLPLSVTYRPLSDNPKIGDEFLVAVDIQLNQDAELQPVTYENQLGDWDVIKVEKGDIECQGDTCQRIDRLTLTSYLPGQIEIPSLPFRFKTKDKQGEFRPLPMTIKVDGLAPAKDDAPGQIRGLKSPRGMISWWWVSGFVLLGGLLLAGVWWWLHRKGLIKSLVKSEPMIPPEVVARQRLQVLKNQKLLEQGEDKAYYIQLTDVLRRYLEARFEINAVDRTTHELAKSLKQTDCQRTDRLRLIELLEYSDLVKFAKAGADDRDADQHWQLVWDFIEKTTPQDEDKAEIASAQKNEAD